MTSSTTTIMDEPVAIFKPRPITPDSRSSNTIGSLGGVADLNRSSHNRDHRFLAASARTVGRMSAAAISPSEEEELHQERQRLLDKKFSVTLTRSEANRLTYLRWTLDRIEDARYGPLLDQIEAKLLQYERLARDIASLRDVLRSSVRTRNRP